MEPAKTDDEASESIVDLSEPEVALSGGGGEKAVPFSEEWYVAIGVSVGK